MGFHRVLDGGDWHLEVIGDFLEAEALASQAVDLFDLLVGRGFGATEDDPSFLGGFEALFHAADDGVAFDLGDFREGGEHGSAEGVVEAEVEDGLRDGYEADSGLIEGQKDLDGFGCVT